ncbi:MAG: hypothetical protein CSA38_01430 [Flavobacteriales bacterium]|nr:MAG: hypothetical protein CSA38_01430 [Flavobacteriales bacterium]
MSNKSIFKNQLFNVFKEQLQSLSAINSVEELLENSTKINELQDILTSLKIINKYSDNEFIDKSNGSIGLIEKSDDNLTKEIIEDEKEIIKEKQTTSEKSLEPEQIIEENETLVDEEPSEKVEESVQNEESKLPKVPKIKLKNTLFEEHEIEVKSEEQIIKKEELPINEPKKQSFKLDLNDRIAFTKVLFNGSQLELKETIDVLNSFEKIEQAQEYLSEVYYQRNWEENEEIAQRLWSLVENKFN